MKSNGTPVPRSNSDFEPKFRSREARLEWLHVLCGNCMRMRVDHIFEESFRCLDAKTTFLAYVEPDEVPAAPRSVEYRQGSLF